MTDNAKPFVFTAGNMQYIGFSDRDLITQTLMQSGTWEAHVQVILAALLQKDPGDFIDIGANMGAITIPLAVMFPEQRFYCFEAQRLVYQQLCGNAVLNGAYNVYPYHMAIGALDCAGQTIDVPMPDYAQDKNIGAISLDARVNDANNESFNRHEKVTMMPADMLGFSNISAIKIDVEGMELPVLQGMVETLKSNNFPAIIFEIWRDNKYDWVDADRKAIVALLESLDYHVDIFERATLGIAQHKTKNPLDFDLGFKTTSYTISATAGG